MPGLHLGAKNLVILLVIIIVLTYFTFIFPATASSYFSWLHMLTEKNKSNLKKMGSKTQIMTMLKSEWIAHFTL